MQRDSIPLGGSSQKPEPPTTLRRSIVEIRQDGQPGPADGALEADDLTEIKGIGPVYTEKLRGLGITTLQQIAEFTPADVEKVDAVLNFKGRIGREKWVEQAQQILATR